MQHVKFAIMFWPLEMSLFYFTDINECVERSDSCDRINGDCINIPGSYQCVCNEGYELDDDGLTCKGSLISDSTL